MLPKSRNSTPNSTQELPPLIEPQQGNNLELEHIIGYSGKYLKTLHYIPKNSNLFVYPIGGSLVLENIDDRHDQTFLRGHDMPISAIDVSSSGRFLASGQLGTVNAKIPESPVILWDLTSKKIRYIFKGLKNAVTNISFSPDDRFLAATSSTNVMMIWDLADNSVVYNKLLEVPFGLITWKIMRKNNSKYPSYYLITSIGTNLVINLLEFDVSSMQYTLKTSNFQLPSTGLVRNYTVAFIDNSGDFLYVGTTGGELCIFNITNNVFKAAIPLSQNGVLSLASSSDSIFIGSGDGKLKHLSGSATRFSQTSEIQLEGRITSLSLSPNGVELLAGTSNGNIYRIMISSLDFSIHTEGHTSSVNDIAFPYMKNELFATIDNDGTILIWDGEELTIKNKCNLMGRNLIGKTVTFSDDGLVVGGWEDGFIRAFEGGKAKNAVLRWEIANAHRGNVTSIFIDSNYILTGGEDGQVRVWSRKHRTLLFQISAHKKTVMKVLPDLQKSNLIHSCSIDKSIHSFDLKTEKKVTLHQAKNGILFDMTQRRDNEQELVTCGVNMPILFWDCDMTEPVEKIDVNVQLLSIDISNGGKYMAAGSEEGEILVYDIMGKNYLGKYLGHSAGVNKLKWSPDEKQIVSVSLDGSICIWNFFS